MSTRSSLWWTKDDEKPSLHLYEELMDDAIHLEIATDGVVVDIVLPPALITKIATSDICCVYGTHGTTDPDHPEPTINNEIV